MNQQKFWNRVSHQSGAQLSKTALKTIQLTKNHIKTTDQVLDFGCGTGNITQEVAHYVRSVIALDTSSGMIEVARKKALESTISNVSYMQTSLLDDIFEEKSFDVVLAYNILHYLENLEAYIQKIYTLLKPNGLFISSTVCLREKASFIRILMYFLSNTRVIPPMKFYTKEELKKNITQQGFELIEVKKISELPEYFMVARKV